MSHIAVVHWTGQTVDKEEHHEGDWSKYGVGELSSLFEHLFPVAHVYDALTEEDGIIVDHKEDVVQVLILGLVLEEVKCHGAKWTNELDPHGVVVAVGTIDGQLESIKAEHHCCQHPNGGKEPLSSVVVLGHKVVVGDAPNQKRYYLMNHNA